MAQQLVNVGTVANDGTGDPLRTAFQKLNANESELYNAIGLALAFSTQTGSFAAAASGRYMLNANGITVTLPTVPPDSTFVQIVSMQTGLTGCSVASGAATIMGQAGPMTIDTNDFSFYLVYRAATGDWRIA